MNERLYLLNIHLLDIEPAISRRFVVPASITLDRLHEVIQIVMGWNNTHLYDFNIGKKCYTEEPEFEEDGLPSYKYRLGDLIKRKGRTFNYTYDFGDNWEHEIVLEDNHFLDPDGQIKLACLEGSRACPPEDVGGVYGYSEFCKAINDPNHEEHESYKDWLGQQYDSEAFDKAAVNGDLLTFLQWSRDRYLNWHSEA